MKPAYYNEHDKYAAQWLRNLIAQKLIAPGDVDERSIADVRPGDLKGYVQCHFFAGIGGWSVATRLAGIPDDEPIWTGSCPCQPFSAAGAQKGTADSRHLWPEFKRLIAQCRPSVVVGEQVASKLGRQWLAGVRADLEGLDYAVGAVDLCAASTGAPHIRQRLFWLADADGGVSGHGNLQRSREHGQQQEDSGPVRLGAYQGQTVVGGSNLGFWTDFNVVYCTDGKARRFEPGSFPLAHGVSNRMGRLRGYGNAIGPQVAAQFLIAAYDSLQEMDKL